MRLSEPSSGVRDLGASLTLSSVWVAVTAVGFFLKPDGHGHGTHQRLGLPPCPSVLLFDRPCPGCGLTTSWTALLHGDLALAFRSHALGPLLYFAFTGFALGTFWLAIRRRRWSETRFHTPIYVVGLALFVGYGLLRMAVTPHYATARERLMVGDVR